jgi:hypothetical protein
LVETEAALATEDTTNEIGDVPRLRAAAKALDDATQPLAEILMDRAVEAMLRKRGLTA